MATFVDSATAIEGTVALPKVIGVITGSFRYAGRRWRYEAHGMQEMLDRLEADTTLRCY